MVFRVEGYRGVLIEKFNSTLSLSHSIQVLHSSGRDPPRPPTP